MGAFYRLPPLLLGLLQGKVPVENREVNGKEGGGGGGEGQHLTPGRCGFKSCLDVQLIYQSQSIPMYERGILIPTTEVETV